jgi:hypothetical protein
MTGMAGCEEMAVRVASGTGASALPQLARAKLQASANAFAA